MLKSKFQIGAPWFQKSADEWLQRILEIHFHPEMGSRYWLEKAAEKRIIVSRDIKSIDDIILFGPMDEYALASRPIEDFIPQCFLSDNRHFILGDTAGTMGTPKITAYRDDEFYIAFVEYFGYVAEKIQFPKRLNWLWIGPGGPHIIGKAARMLAERMGSMDPFSIDFDARWIKKLMPGSIGWERYFQHVEDQAMHLLHSQDIGVLFSTPPVLERLAKKMSAELQHKIRGVHYGGMSLHPELYKQLKNKYFPKAVHLSGYGNTLFGVCLEVEDNKEGNLHYFPPGVRLLIRIVPPGKRDDNIDERLGQTVNYGERGQVVFSRFDESFLILNMLERDFAVRIPPSTAAQELGLHLDGLADPGPAPSRDKGKQAVLGLY
jgi:phenylacetate-coenzyme A ligase PaaK-like adenylate-forming protein